MDNAFTSYKLEDRSYVSFIKREIHQSVVRAGFTETQTAEIDLIVAELSTNLIKHAGAGELLWRVMDEEENPSFEVISIDNGPGMFDAAKMLKDGVSTTKTLGHGLGSIQRLSDVAQIYSLPAWGTIHYALKRRKQKTAAGKPRTPDIRAVCVNKPRETVCGDGYRVKQTGPETLIFFGDGLGHGPAAREAIDRAGDFFFECEETDPVAILRKMHEKVRRTRGLVGNIASCNPRTKTWRLCGVGNIFTRMYSGMEIKNYMPYNGTIGLNLPHSMNSTMFPLESNQHLIMCSDGIRTRWDLNRFPSIFKYDHTLLASAIYKDYCRGTDDASVLVAKVL